MKPYATATAWIGAIWDSINELRDKTKVHDANFEHLNKTSAENVDCIEHLINEVKRLENARISAVDRLNNVERALGPGIYGEWPDGPLGKEYIGTGPPIECKDCPE